MIWDHLNEMSADIQPDVIDGVPLCSDNCPANDGKRCTVTSFRTDRHCEPAIKKLVEEHAAMVAKREAVCNDVA